MNHGEAKGYWAHVLNLEPPCDACFEAYKRARSKRFETYVNLQKDTP